MTPKSYSIIVKSLDADVALRTRLAEMLQTTPEEKAEYAQEISDTSKALIEFHIFYERFAQTSAAIDLTIQHNNPPAGE
jgi:hypothetical protein